MRVFFSYWSREGTLFRGIFVPALGRKAEGREISLLLLFLRCLQLKIINMSKWHIWGSLF